MMYSALLTMGIYYSLIKKIDEIGDKVDKTAENIYWLRFVKLSRVR